MTTKNYRKHRAFTLVELLGVLLILSVLIALLLPAVQQARETARRTQCRNNLLQLGIAFANYQMTHSVLPPGCISRPGFEGRLEGNYRISWAAQLLPFIEQKGLYASVDFDSPEHSFQTPEDREKSKRTMGLWIELRTLKGLPLIELESSPEEQKNVDGSTTEPSASIDPVDETPKTDEPATAVSDGNELQRAARILEIETALNELGHTNHEEPPVPSILARSPAGGNYNVMVLHCPSSPATGVSYAGSHHSADIPISNTADGLLYLDSSESLRSIPDGASVTILAGEHTGQRLGHSWLFGSSETLRNGGPIRAKKNTIGRVLDFSSMSDQERKQTLRLDSAQLGSFGSSHSFEHVHFLLADGSVKVMAATIDSTIIARMVSRNDGF